MGDPPGDENAHDLVRQHAAAALDQLQPRLPELAAALAATDAFRAARLVDARRHVADNWIAMHHTDGLRMPTWWIRELVAAERQPRSELNLG